MKRTPLKRTGKKQAVPKDAEPKRAPFMGQGLKRKPLARKPMKRARMKRMKRKPRFYGPVAREAYREANPVCEWEKYLGYAVPSPPDDARRFMPPEVNHIFTNPRRDEMPILITLSKVAHDYFHRNIHFGRMACLLVKFLKGEQDIPLWSLAFGKDVYGWVQTWRYAPGTFQESVRVRLLEQFDLHFKALACKQFLEEAIFGKEAA